MANLSYLSKWHTLTWRCRQQKRLSIVPLISNNHHLKSPRSLTVSSASRSHSGSVSHQGILSTPVPFVPRQSGLPEIQFDFNNSRSKVKVKGALVSAASSWLISLVFYIGATYRLPSLSFLDNRAAHSRDTIWPWIFKVRVKSKVKVKIKGILVGVAPSWFISFLFYINWTNRSSDMANRMFDWAKQIWSFTKKNAEMFLTEFLKNLIK